MKRTLITTSIIFLAGCAASGQPFSGFITPQKGNGSVYVYRPEAFVGGAVGFNIKADDEPIGILRNGGYLYKELPTGTHFLSATTELTRTQKISVTENQPVCVRFGVGFGVVAARPEFQPIDLETCQFEIKHTKESK